MSEWIVSSEDLGCDGAYFSYTEVVRCRDCKYFHRRMSMFGIEYTECDMMSGRQPTEEDFCSWGVRK